MQTAQAPSFETLHNHPDLLEIEAGFAAIQAEHEAATRPRHEYVFDAIREQVIDDQPVGRSAEDGSNDDWICEQEYSHSTRVIAMVGSLAVKGELDTREGQIAKETLRERFESSVIEMLHTDHEFREKLEINRERRHIVRGGRVMALDGKTQIVGMCDRGAKKAAMDAAASQPMEAVADRCAADARVARRIEELPIGGTLVGASVDPKEAMAMYGESIYEELGFRKGLAFLQWYHRLDEHTLLAATYSVDQSDLAIWREVWSEFGGRIPAGEATNTWLDHDITRQGTLEEARAFVEQIRARYYEKKGVNTKRYSVDEFMQANQANCDELFESLYMKLTVAHETRVLDRPLTVFVDRLLQGAQYLNPKIRKQLSTIQQADRLQTEDIALIEQLVRYAVTERLRTALNLLGTAQPAKVKALVVPNGVNEAEFLAASSAGNVIVGARANRTYGGCTRSINPGERGSNTPDSSSDRPQDAFGGRDDGSGDKAKWRWKKGICQVTNCPTRPNTTLVGPCSVCWSCQRKFDNGQDPTAIYASRAPVKLQELAALILKPFRLNSEKRTEGTT